MESSFSIFAKEFALSLIAGSLPPAFIPVTDFKLVASVVALFVAVVIDDHTSQRTHNEHCGNNQ